MKNIRIRFLSLGLGLVILFLAISVITPSKVALAGSNGQQVLVSYSSVCRQPVPSQRSYQVKISGTNQNGKVVSWTSSWSGGCSNGPSGWWWVGQISVSVTMRDINNYTYGPTRYYNIPKSQSSDWISAIY